MSMKINASLHENTLVIPAGFIEEPIIAGDYATKQYMEQRLSEEAAAQRAYSDAMLASAKEYSDNNLAEAKGYADSKSRITSETDSSRYQFTLSITQDNFLKITITEE